MPPDQARPAEGGEQIAADRLARELASIVALFKDGGWTELRVEGEAISLLLSRDAGTPPLGEATGLAEPARAIHAAEPAVALAGAAAIPAADAVDAGWTAVLAPNLGTFYRAPKPGMAPFVEVGQHVDAETEVCLIEVMKLFTSVRAGVAGMVRRIAVADAELVQGGQPLLYIQPD